MGEYNHSLDLDMRVHCREFCVWEVKMKVLIACEFSGIVREAFMKKGHNAWSCDLLKTEIPSEKHIQGDIKSIDLSDFDMMIAFPPCTYLCSSGARWWSGKEQEQKEAIEFVWWLWNQSIQKITIENPIGILSTVWRKPDQIIQPWQFGHGETKATCLWLKNLPVLKATCIVNGRNSRVHREPPSSQRWKNRSRTYQGIAEAMANQWGRLG